MSFSYDSIQIISDPRHKSINAHDVNYNNFSFQNYDQEFLFRLIARYIVKHRHQVLCYILSLFMFLYDKHKNWKEESKEAKQQPLQKQAYKDTIRPVAFKE